MTDLKSELETLRTIGGYCEADEFGLIEVYGNDSGKFLQAQTTNDTLSLSPSSSQPSCLLDRKAKLQAFFDLYRRHDSYRLIAEKRQVDEIITHLDYYRVADKVEFLDLTQTGHFLALQGPRCRKVLHAGMQGTYRPSIFKSDVVDLRLWEASVHLFRKSITGEDGYLLWVTQRDWDKFRSTFTAVASEHGLVKMDAALRETARVEAGLLQYSVDFDKESFLPETGLDQLAVSYTKGCFLGQEVLARVRSQGAPTRGLVGLMFPEGTTQTFKPGTAVEHEGEEIAIIKSNVFSPTFNTVIAIASAKRDYRVPGKTINATVHDTAFKLSVSLLPFYTAEPLRAKARRLYEQALALYAKENDLGAQSQAVDLLHETLELDPVFEDGYEALGVIQSKRGHLDEAIELMKQLVELNAESVMAHTNLSVFYVEKGWKDEAEEEKAVSVSIRMRLAMKETEKKPDQSKLDQEATETKQRMTMFKDVLAIDGEDLLANYGVGSCHVALTEFEQAVPFLKKAIEIKSTYTQAYLSLGKAYEGMGDLPEAMKTYELGVEVAAKRGDMTPLTEMQQHLTRLKAHSEARQTDTARKTS